MATMKVGLTLLLGLFSLFLRQGLCSLYTIHAVRKNVDAEELVSLRSTDHHLQRHNTHNIITKAGRRIQTDYGMDRIIVLSRMRGGQVISGKKKKSLLKTVKELLGQVRPATRVHLLISLFCTVVHMIGLPAPALFALDISKFYEIWRPFTSVAYFGKPSMSMANSVYFLIRYGQTLETLNGTGDHAWFLLVQTAILTALGLLLGFPSQAQAMISAAVYVSSRMNPMEKIPFQFGLIITSWQLPFCMMIIDCLSQQNIAAAWPHVLGIFSGHIYHFFTRVWPSLGGTPMLMPPKWFIKRLGGKPTSNVAGVDFRKGNSDQKVKKVVKKLGKARTLSS